ncbi:hypothetical protein ACI65C_006112 [Semiaphis heraclei]
MLSTTQTSDGQLVCSDVKYDIKICTQYERGMQQSACQTKREANTPTHCRATDNKLDNSKCYCSCITITVLPNAGLSRIGIRRTKIESPPLTRLTRLPHRTYTYIYRPSGQLQ